MRNKKLIILFSVLLSITLLVVFNSVLFSVQHVNAYCENIQEDKCAQSRENVLAHHKIRKGGSIFFVNESKVVHNVESNVSNVRVLNVERKFPNRVYINYVEVCPYLKVESDGQTYFCGNDMHVITYHEGEEPQKIINLRFNGAVRANGNALVFTSAQGDDMSAVVTQIFAGLERLGLYESVIEMFSEIDLTGSFIELKTRVTVMDGDELKETEGVTWEIQTADNLAEKLRLALTVYEKKLTTVQRRVGKLIIAGNKAFYRGASGTVEEL